MWSCKFFVYTTYKNIKFNTINELNLCENYPTKMLLIYICKEKKIVGKFVLIHRSCSID